MMGEADVAISPEVEIGGERAPRCSVVIPTAGPASSLGAVLRALSDQTIGGDAVELIVVDNNQDSAASEHLGVVTEPFPVRTVRAATPGPAAARNQGLAASRGQVVVFVDDDIVVPPDFLAAHLAVHEGAVPVVGVGRVVEHNDRSKWFRRYLIERRVLNRAPDPERIDFRTFYGANASVTLAALLEVGGYDEGFARREDAELAYRLMAHGADFRYVPDAVVDHHSHFGPLVHLRRSYWNGYYLAKLIEKHPDVSRHENMVMYSRTRQLASLVIGPLLIAVGVLVYPVNPWPLFKGLTALVLVQNNRGFRAYRRKVRG